LEAEIFEAIEKRPLRCPPQLDVNHERMGEEGIKTRPKVQKKRGDGYKVIPILLDGLSHKRVVRSVRQKVPLAVRCLAPWRSRESHADLLAASAYDSPTIRNSQRRSTPRPSRN